MNYFGQLAERYLLQARGACAVFEIHRINYKPKIPWWEWVEQVVDIWDPTKDLRNPELQREQLLGALGVGPRPDAVATLSLGAALVTAARLHRELTTATEPVQATNAIRATFSEIHEHAVKAFSHQLQGAARAQHNLGKLARSHLTEAKKSGS